MQKKLEEEKSGLLNFCTLPNSQKKILEIAVGILRKNEKETKQIDALDAKIKNLTTQIKHLYK